MMARRINAQAQLVNLEKSKAATTPRGDFTSREHDSQAVKVALALCHFLREVDLVETWLDEL
jgi:hypothetical protein